MFQKVVRLGQLSLLFLIGVFLFAWSYFNSSFSFLDTKQILGITIALIASIIFYYDNVLTKLFHSKNNITHIDLPSAIRIAKEYSNDLRHIRIYAMTTNMIQPILKGIGIKCSECSILLYEPNITIEEQRESLNNYLVNIKMLINEWNLLKAKGNIYNIDIKKYSFTPTEYLIIFDEKVLIRGNYFLDVNHTPFCDVQDPILVINNNSENKLLIEKSISFFDNTFNNIL